MVFRLSVLWYLQVCTGQYIIKKIEKCSVHCRSAQAADQMETLMMTLGLKRPVMLLSNDIIQSPFITGIYEPKIYLPEYSFTQAECELLLKHELIHCKNRDCFFADLYFCCVHSTGLIRLSTNLRSILSK